MKFINHLNPRNLPASVRGKDVLVMQREIILQHVLNLVFAICTVGLPIVLIFFPDAIRSGRQWLYIGVFGVLAVLTIVRVIPYSLRAGVVLSSLVGFGVMALISYGLAGTGPLFLLGAVTLANILFTHRFAQGLGLFVAACLAAIGILMIRGNLPAPQGNIAELSTSVTQWTVMAMVFIFMGFLSSRSLISIFQGLTLALKNQQVLTRELEEERISLEQRVEERSTVLKTRIAQFEVASQVARDISGQPNMETLLNNAVNLIRDRFDYYYVSIFMTDERGEYANLRAGTGEAGRVMLERGHRLKIGEIGIVGYVVSRGEARIATNVQSDMVHFKNPLLPETRSEMALPLHSGGKVIGALDVQSVAETAFTQDDINILQTIADQLAVAFEKTRLVEQLQRSVEELETYFQQSTQKAWHTHLRSSRKKFAYRYKNDRLDNRVEQTDHARKALEAGSVILEAVPGVDADGKPVMVLAVPIKLRNQVLGVVDIHFQSNNVSPDLISLIEGTVNRLAVSLENARLLEEIQLSAERERMVSEISSKVRGASDVDSVMRIAIEEIGRSLGVSEVMVQLRQER